MPSILDTMVRDATGYFALIFSIHFVSVLFVFVAPVGVATTRSRGFHHMCAHRSRIYRQIFSSFLGCKLPTPLDACVAFRQLTLTPTCIPRANTILIPVMASRLMLSLKKASVGPRGVWSLDTMTNAASGNLEEDGTIRFASRVPNRFREIQPNSSALDGENIELNASRWPPRIAGHDKHPGFDDTSTKFPLHAEVRRPPW